MNRRALVIGLGGLVLVGLAVGWFLLTFERVSEEVRLPPQGEAARNPLYALRSALRAHGESADTQRWIRLADWKPGAGDTLVLYGQAAPFTAAETTRVLEWVRGGGHLVLRSRNLVGAPALGQGLGLVVEGEDSGCVQVRKPGAAGAGDDDDDPADVLGRMRRASLPRLCGVNVHAGPARDATLVQLGGEDPQGGHRFARVRLGAGRATVVTDLDFLHNDALEHAQARELAFQVLAPSLGGDGRFLLVYGDDMPSLLRLLLQAGWPVLIPAALALFAWLALRSQRVGTLQPLPAAHRRALLEHVQAAGEFAFRRGRALALHTAVRERFERRLARRDPMLAALEGEARVLALAERCSLPAQRVRQALAPGELRPDTFFHSVSTLALMRLRI